MYVYFTGKAKGKKDDKKETQYISYIYYLAHVKRHGLFGKTTVHLGIRIHPQLVLAIFSQYLIQLFRKTAHSSL